MGWTGWRRAPPRSDRAARAVVVCSGIERTETLPCGARARARRADQPLGHVHSESPPPPRPTHRAAARPRCLGLGGTVTRDTWMDTCVLGLTGFDECASTSTSSRSSRRCSPSSGAATRTPSACDAAVVVVIVCPRHRLICLRLQPPPGTTPPLPFSLSLASPPPPLSLLVGAVELTHSAAADENWISIGPTQPPKTQVQRPVGRRGDDHIDDERGRARDLRRRRRARRRAHHPRAARRRGRDGRAGGARADRVRFSSSPSVRSTRSRRSNTRRPTRYFTRILVLHV